MRQLKWRGMLTIGEGKRSAISEVLEADTGEHGCRGAEGCALVGGYEGGGLLRTCGLDAGLTIHSLWAMIRSVCEDIRVWRGKCGLVGLLSNLAS